MRKTILLVLFIFFTCFGFAQNGGANYGIIPAPSSIQGTGGEFTLDRETALMFESEEDHRICQLFHDFVRDNYGLDLVIAKNFIRAPKSVIRFESNTYNGDPEGYKISASLNQITVSGQGPGLFYGMQTLMQLFPLDKGEQIKIPCVQVEDQPRYRYRGMHLDVGRHLFPVPFIKEYIDLLAKYKLNTFHWHLTDDQGWRIEIKKYPLLTQKGAWREQTLIGNYHDRNPQWFDNTPYGGFYTQDQIKEVVAYAKERYVSVIPEIEMPGHALAALAAYPSLGCGDNPGPFKVAEKWGVFENVFCPGKDSTFLFLEDVLTEVMDLFPGTYIHIGGDECPKSEWKKCPYCQKRIRQNKLKDEHQLQSYFIRRIEKFLNSRGRKIIGWDEILEGGLAPNATVMSWRGTKGGIAAARQNHEVIMTPGNFVYFDHLQGNALQEPVSIGGYTPLSEVYSYDPTPSVLTAAQQSKIIGVQANVWTEYISTAAKVEYMVLPRIYALSEIAWTPLARKDYTDFEQNRVPLHLGRLDRTSSLYRVPNVTGARDTTLTGADFSFDLKPPVAGAKIYYTLDERTPRETDEVYTNKLRISVPLNQKRVLKVIAITPSGKRSAVTTTILSNETAFEPVAYDGSQRDLNFYFVPGVFDSAASVDTSKASEKGFSSAINSLKFRNRSAFFGLVFSGYINILNDGIYTFTTSSDDGSVLLIDGQVVVNNDGKHAAFELSSGVSLKKGFHRFEVKYLQAGGVSLLKVYMSGPGESRYEIPPGLLFH